MWVKPRGWGLRAWVSHGVLVILLCSHIAFVSIYVSVSAFPTEVLWSYLRSDGSSVFGEQSCMDRPWDRAFLERGSSAMHFEQMSPVIERLRSGHPLTVVGIGSSVMAGHGGCFHRDAQQLLHGRAHGVARWGSQLEPCAQPHGFVGAFMLELNRSYPHPDHVFVNLGMPGTELEHFARRHCFLAAVPPKVDLVIVEQRDWVAPSDAGHAFKRRGRMLEELWVQLQARGRGAHAPAFVVFSTAFAVDAADEGRRGHLEQCVRRCGETGGAVPPECEDFESHLFSRSLTGVGGDGVEDQHSGVLHWYGMAEVSLRNLAASAVRDGLWDMPECALVGRFWEDAVHPRKGLGHLLIADSLLLYVERAEEFWADSAAATRYQARPHVPVNRGAWDVPFRQCFDHDHHGGIPVDRAASHGWELTDEGGGKPGWVASAAGAELTLRLDTAELSAGREAAGAAAEPVTLTFTYLQGGEAMGSAKYACSGGCECAAGQIAASGPGGEQQAGGVDEYHLVNVTQARECVVRLENAQEGKKFKLLSVVLSTVAPYRQIALQHREQWRARRRDGRGQAAGVPPAGGAPPPS